jgi:hypothetical protein
MDALGVVYPKYWLIVQVMEYSYSKKIIVLAYSSNHGFYER